MKVTQIIYFDTVLRSNFEELDSANFVFNVSLIAHKTPCDEARDVK